MSSIRETAEDIARRGIPYSWLNNEDKYRSALNWIANEIEQALHAERTRCANIVNNARFEDHFTDLRELVSRIRSEP